MTGSVRRSARTRLATAAVSTALVVGGLAWLAGRTTSPDGAAARAAPPTPGLVTATVEERALVRSWRSSCTVDAANPVAVPLGVDGTAVVTADPHPPDAPVEPGTVLVEVQGRPVVALRAPFPFYRDLAPGDEGPDVSVLSSALEELGYLDGAPRSRFDGALSSAIERLYRDRGYPPPPPDADRAARLAASEAALHAATTAAAAGDSVAPGEPALAQARRDLQEATAAARSPMRASEVFTAAQYPLRVLAPAPAVGATHDASLRLSTGGMQLRCGPPPAATAVPVGTVAETSAADGSPMAGKVVARGSVDRSAPQATDGATTSPDAAAGGPSPEAGALLVELDQGVEQARRLEGTTVVASFALASTDGPRLLVPLAALRGSEASPLVERVGSDGRVESVDVAIEMATDGFAALRPGAGLQVGDHVVVSW